MLDHHSRSLTDNWPESPTRRAAFRGVDPAAATMAQPTVATAARPADAAAYAWSAEPVVAEDPAPTKRAHSRMRPTTVAGVAAGAVAAAAAALIVVFSGHATSPVVATPTASTPIAGGQTAAAAPTTPQVAQPSESTPPVTRQQPRPRQPARASYQEPEPERTNTTSDQDSEDQQSAAPRHGDQWRSSHDSTLPRWNWNFFRPDFDTSEHRDGDHDRSRGHRDQQSTERHSDSSSDGHE